MSRTEYMKQWKKNNPDKVNANGRRYYHKNREHILNDRRERPERIKSSRLLCDYGITLNEWNQLFQSQSNSCAICRIKESVWHTDHDHMTGLVRGILCNNCNLGLGQFRDNKELLLEAANYLGSKV